MKEIFYIDMERSKQAKQLENQEEKFPVRRRTREQVRKMINTQNVPIPKALANIKLPEEKEETPQVPKRRWKRAEIREMIKD